MSNLQPYQKETISMIREAAPVGIRNTSDESLASLYSEWSEASACAQWLAPNEQRIKEFVRWAATPPYLNYV